MSYQYSQNLVQSTNVPGGSMSYSTAQQQVPGRTLIDSSSADHPIQLANSNQVVSQILTTTQGSPTRQSKTFVYRSESPIRSSTYGKHVVNVSHIEKGQAPIYVSQSTVQNPIYVEKIVKVESSNTSELNILRQRIASLESQNKTLTEELITLRNNTPQEVEQIVYIENNDEINKLRYELNNIRALSESENDNVKRSKKNLEDQFSVVIQERDRMIIQLKELTVKITEFQSLISSKDIQINTLKVQNEALATRLVLTTAELERVTREKVESEPLRRKIVDLESYLVIQEKTIEELRIKLGQQDQVISQLRLLEIRSSQYEQEINGLKLKIEEFLRTIQNYQQIISQKDDELSKLRMEINQLQIRLQGLGGTQDELENVKRAFNQKLQECEDLKRKLAEYDLLVIRCQQLEARLQESEQNSLLLIKKIEELQALLNDEGVKRSKNRNDLDISLRDKQALEEKLVHLTQQIEFLTRKVQSQDQEINQYRLRIVELEGLASKVSAYEQQIQYLNQQIERLNAILLEKDQYISKITLEINQLKLSNTQIVQLQEQLVNGQQIIVLRTAEIEALRKRVSEYEVIINQLRMYESRVQEYEQIINQLRQRINDLENQYNDENIKRSKKDGELAISLRDKQALEEKLVHMSQQIEFMSQKINQLTALLQERDNTISQLRIFEIRVKEFESVIAALRQRNAELEGNLNDENVKRSKKDGELAISLRDKQALEEKLVHMSQQIEFLNMKVSSYEKQIQEKDTLINQLRIEISQLQINVQQLSNASEEVRRLTELLVVKTTEIDQLRKRLAELEMSYQEFHLVQAKLQECEKNNALLRQRIAELESLLNDENIKRSRNQNDLDISLRDKQALEEKLVHLTQQIEFMSRKITQLTEENNNLKIVVSSYQQIFDEWSAITIRHGNFSQLLEQLRVRVQQISFSSSTIVTQSSTSYVKSSGFVNK